MKKIGKYQKTIRKIAHRLESFLSIIILISVFLGALDMIRVLWESYFINHSTPVGYEEINSFLGQIILLVIGLELVIMFTLHSSKALLEVLVFAIAHKLLLMPKTQGMFDLLMGIIGIACLFAIKKYLIIQEPNKLQNNNELEDESNYIV